MIRKIAMVMLALSVALPLAACGRKGKPIAPEDSVYPRQYPNPNLYAPQQRQPEQPEQQ